MILVTVVAALVILAVVTQAGVFALQRAYPGRGRMIEVAGATLNVVDIGPRDAAGPPVVMIHGALKALLLVNEKLEAELQQLYVAVAVGATWSRGSNSLH